MQSISLSVIIPAYNEANNIAETLQALVANSRRPDEIIVVDNNSTDHTARVASSFPDVRVVHEPRPGVVHARTAGFDAATGDIIARLDADTVPSPSWCQTIIDAFTSDEQLTVVTGLYAVADISPPGKFWGKPITRLFRAWNERSLSISPLVFGGNMALCSSAWHQAKPFTHPEDPRINEDIDLRLAFEHIDAKIIFLPRMMAKTQLLRSLSPQKIRRYRSNDFYTINLHARRQTKKK